jgi:hypothetical protein
MPPVASTADGLKATLGFEPAAPMSGAQNTAILKVTDAAKGGAVTDLQPYLGAMGHMVLVHQDGTTYVHSHPDEALEGVGKDGTIPFLARFAKPGWYRCWAQVQRGGCDAVARGHLEREPEEFLESPQVRDRLSGGAALDVRPVPARRVRPDGRLRVSQHDRPSDPYGMSEQEFRIETRRLRSSREQGCRTLPQQRPGRVVSQRRHHPRVDRPGRP